MFRFLDPGPLIDDDLELVLVERATGDPTRQRVPAYRFEMRHPGSRAALGAIDLRVGDVPHLVLYGGHIGYRVDAAHRGRHYAARAVRLLVPLARAHGMRTLWSTCNPENTASRRTCELAGAVYVETVELPPDSDMYLSGDRRKCRYRLDVGDQAIG